MMVTAESDNGGMSDTTSSPSSIHVQVQTTGERSTFKAMKPKSPKKDCKLHEHQKRRLPIVRPPPKPTSAFDELFQNLAPHWRNPTDVKDVSSSSCKSSETNETTETEYDSDSGESWTSEISVLKTGATYSKIRPEKIRKVDRPPSSYYVGEGDQRRLHIPELEINFTDEDLKRVKFLRFFPIGYATSEPLYYTIEPTPRPQPRVHPPKMHELNDDWERFEVDLPEYNPLREYIHDKRLRLLTLGLQPPRRFIGNEDNFDLHKFLIAQAQFLMDMPGYDPEKEFPLRNIFDLKTMKYKPRPGSITPKIEVADDPSPNVQDSMDTKDDSALQNLNPSQTNEDSRLLDSFVKEEPKSDVPNDEENESGETDVENAKQDDDDSQNSDDESDMEEDVENAERDEREEEMENSEQDDDNTRIAESSETESYNKSGDDSESGMDSDDTE